VDDDCDGVIDNPGQCTTAITCNNGVQDVNENGIDCGGPCAKVCQMPFYSWLLIGIVIIFSLLVFWTIAIRTKF
jgi:hypothetical protein